MPDIQPTDPTGIENTPLSTAQIQRWETPLTVILLAVTVCFVFADSIFFKKAYYWGDIGLFFLPLNQFLKTSIAAGHIPLWNPYLFCGAPYVGNPQVSVFYPTNLLLPFLPAVSAIMISEALHIFVGGLFFWIFARFGSIKLNYLPSLLAALIYMLSGYFVAKAQFPNMLAALSYVPILLYLTERLVISTNTKTTISFGIGLGFQLLAAHTQITVFSLYLMVAYGLWVYSNLAQPRTSFFGILACGLVGGAIAAGLAGAYWLPTAELIHSSARQVLSLRTANRFYLPWYELCDFVLPHHYGSPMRGDWRAHGNYWETDNYVGWFTFALFAYGLYDGLARVPGNARTRKQAIYWLTMFAVSTWLSLGMSGGLYSVAFVLLPGLKLFHDPGRLMLGSTVAVALFGGYGLQVLLANVQDHQRLLAGALVILICTIDMGWHAHTLYPVKSVSQIAAMSTDDVPKLLLSDLSSPGSGRIMMPDSQRAWQSFTTYRTFEQNDPTFMDEWPDTMSPCLGMTYGIREVGGYDPEFRRDSQELVSIAQILVVPPVSKHPRVLPPPPSEFASYLGMLGVQYIVTYRTGKVDDPDLQPIWSSPWRRRLREVVVYKNLRFPSRANIYNSWINEPGQSADFSDVWQTLLAPGTTGFDVPRVERSESSQNSGDNSSEPVRFVRDDPDRVDLVTQPLTTQSILVLADTLHPGWTATVDGRKAKIYRANVDQRSVVLPGSASPVRHFVSFIYRPVDFLFGYYLSLMTLGIVLGGFIGFGASVGDFGRARRT